MRRAICAVSVLVALFVAFASAARAGATGGPITGPLTKAGIWTVDDQGRVVVLHGFDILRKVAPFYPDNFTEQDARFLVDEGFDAARIGWIWSGAEPQPGKIDDAYIAKLAGFERLLGRYGIRTLVDDHQDDWTYNGTYGDGAPAWATLGSNADEDFSHFWNNDKASDGVGIQTHFLNVWKHVASALASSSNVLGYDPFNEPYPGSSYPSPCADFAPCPQFEKTQLAAFYRRAIAAIRGAGARQLIEVETTANNAQAEPQLPAFDDPESGFTFHYYCVGPGPEPFFILQMEGGSQAFDQAMDASGCPDQERNALDLYLTYVKKLAVPTFDGEFSAADTNEDNARMVDLLGERFVSWTIWHYYSSPDPGGVANQGILLDDRKPGSENNAKQPKLDALVVPYLQAIAGTPTSYAFDRATNTMTASWSTHPAGRALAACAPTQIFVPQRKYPYGYSLTVTGGKVVSALGAAFAEVLANPGAKTVSATLTPSTGSFTQRPLETGDFPLNSLPATPPDRIEGNLLGPVRLGMTRRQLQGEIGPASTRGFRYMDFFCPGIGIRVGYASARLLGTLRGVDRRRLTGRAVLVLTANPYYTLHGIRPGDRLTQARRELRLSGPFHIGLNYWYLGPNGASRGVLKVRHGTVEEIGIANNMLTVGNRQARRFLRSFF